MVSDHCGVGGNKCMNSQRFVSIRIKLLSLLFICILVPFLVYWFFSYEYIKTSLDEEFVSQTTDTMHATRKQHFRLCEAGGLYGARSLL